MARVFIDLSAAMSFYALVCAEKRLANCIRQARSRRGWTQYEFASQIDTSIGLVRRIERGGSSVSLLIVMRGALHLGLLREFNRLLAIRHRQYRDWRGHSGHSTPRPAVVAAPAQATVDVVALPENPQQLPHEPQARLLDHLTVCLGQTSLALGRLNVYTQNGEVYSEFAYDEGWLNSPRFFPVSPDLAHTAEPQRLTPRQGEGLNVFAALAETAPSGFGLQVMSKASEIGLLGASNWEGRALRVLKGLKAVPNVARLGALRLVSPEESPVELPHARRTLPRESDLPSLAAAVYALEGGAVSSAQLQLLVTSATALGGSRPKVTWLGKDNALWVAKLPKSFGDSLSNRSEALAMSLAEMAGIDCVAVTLRHSPSGPFLIAPRFDREGEGKRKHVLSARGMLHANECDVISPLELLGVMRERCLDFSSDARELWQRLLFMCLIRQPGDELRKISFVYAGNGLWRLAPAYGLRLHSFSMQSLKAQQAAGSGLEMRLLPLMKGSSAFGMEPKQALDQLRRQLNVLARWRDQAAQLSVGMSQFDMAQFQHAMTQTAIEGATLAAKCGRELDIA
ncbi:MAG: HipA domain-containing protein [Hydrogenophaga sp.]|uniref:HipA domain-containing protein n=1 Tax=Hydrogenophaga sp. TaxID=1904254 RepID=UPI0025797811|nr:HipA domain-containing protein [Hydrogenophaga sp.]MBL0943551.1 HipA domain-containing protein [Hydrogenophaga sp.]